MRDTSGTGRSAATGGCRMLFLLALLALLITALTAGYSDAASSATGKCPTHAGAPALGGTAERTCDTTGYVLAPSSDAHHHPGNGFRRLCHATACHLRPHVPTGPSGKALRESAAGESSDAPGHTAPRAVLPAAATGTPARVTVLRC
ncbi:MULTISPECIES: hypothetical protein [unclassified Streptomyces]|uniref:hypothetical protein n=1 Tax=unclassified Streptomyces TaxID=2593676 RepID=UPI000C27BBF4|nr:hypothetical protein [Streptomyces sp. CB02959]PJN38507.1 hypothetical protein CG747_22985 [Streptomyces sp. CB02959]